MGGPGSTRWGGHRRARTVEESAALDVRSLERDGCLRPGASWRTTWTRGDLSVSASTAWGGGSLLVTLRYPVAGEEVAVPVRVEEWRAPFKRRRSWFRCPLTVDGVACGRHVRTLYLPSGRRYFGCARCHGLTYRVRQEHDKTIDRLARDPEARARAIDRLTRRIEAEPLDVRALLLADRLDAIEIRECDRRLREQA